MAQKQTDTPSDAPNLSDASSASPKDIAKKMLELLDSSRSGELNQEDAAERIRKEFGEEFLYQNENGNPAIDPKVLEEFRKLSGADVVWSRSGRLWRKRQAGDPKRRRQVD